MCAPLLQTKEVFSNLLFAKPMVCMRVAFHENDGNPENDENDEDNSDKYKQGVECWIGRNHGNHGNDENSGVQVPQTTGLERPDLKRRSLTGMLYELSELKRTAKDAAAPRIARTMFIRALVGGGARIVGLEQSKPTRDPRAPPPHLQIGCPPNSCCSWTKKKIQHSAT